MGVYIKNWSLADWKELLKWAKIGANNAMIGEFTEVEEVPPHGRLIDADAFLALINDSTVLSDFLKCIINPLIRGEPTVIEAEEGE